jgi:bifunctional DNase/RNase
VTALRSSAAARIGYALPRYLLLFSVGLAAGCSRPASRDVEVEVSQVALDPDSRMPVVLLEDKGHTVALPIWIGPSEANAIAERLAGIESPRPLTHDLMKAVMDRVGVALQRVVIRELRDNTYYASLILLWKGEEMEVDSRPSDAIALAVRFGQPIFVDRALLEGQGALNLRAQRDEPLDVDGVTVQRLSAEMADYFELPAGQGVVVSGVSPAAAVLHRGDVILEVDGRPVRDPADFRAQLEAHGGRAELSVQRDGARLRVAFASDARAGVD